MNFLHTRLARSLPPAIAFFGIIGICRAQAPARPASRNDSALASLSLEELLNTTVTTPSLHGESVVRAAADVTVITAEDIRIYGWRTLGEILNHVRGFYVSYDHTYQELGAMGFSVPGDWSTRVLVMINGHNMADNVFGSASYFAEDFPLDMSLVDHVEVMRGTSSALYGSNGMLATINVITRKAAGSPRGGSVRLETGSLGQKRATVTGSTELGKGIKLLASGSIFNNGGQSDIYFPEFDTPANNNGHARNMDGDRGYRLFTDIQAGNWEILAFTGTRLKLQPVSWNETVFNDRGTRAIDQHSVVVGTWTRELAHDRQLKWETSWDGYRFNGIYRVPVSSASSGKTNGTGTIGEFDAGDWITSRLTYRFPWLKGTATAGGEGKFDLRALQSQAELMPVYVQQLSINKLDQFAAGFLQMEWELGKHWSVTSGVRYDWSHYRSSAVSPRGGLIYRPDTKTTLKLLYGVGFRNPNANELFFSDGISEVGNLALKPERARSVQAVASRQLSKAWRLEISAYRTGNKDIILPVSDSSGLTQFVNSDRFQGKGIGGELSGNPFPFLQVVANLQQQQSWLGDRQRLPNSPHTLGKVRFSVPLRGSRLQLSGGVLYESERRTLAGDTIDPVWLPELTLVSRNLISDFDLQVGVRNLANSTYLDPIGLTPTVDKIRQPGRTFFVTFTRSFGK